MALAKPHAPAGPLLYLPLTPSHLLVLDTDGRAAINAIRLATTPALGSLYPDVQEKKQHKLLGQ